MVLIPFNARQAIYVISSLKVQRCHGQTQPCLQARHCMNHVNLLPIRSL
jgi:hypothetical protein